ncbi:hypothetical protein AWL63_06870 [Sphingomonas panacis]|uniref:Uncharacterized protein n=1 Tax=Sphingomonas panacis TaxID=1560345 RepID=A0A1B3Z8I5_9SPHN|nr:hypothetical protein [Sphingomonas panacis]AOH83731.1 hypothetical protein AWL63_06870 [Sphingomonas panacis]
MATVDGQWNIVVRTPLGEQKAMLNVVSAGTSFTGNLSGALGSVEVKDGTVDGDTLAWVMSITSPMPMKLECTATVDGDTLTGSVGAGGLGSFPVSGVRA